jgi:cytoplasmic iron level regulating protein YaaA (DUF328/UPF0246 family)
MERPTDESDLLIIPCCASKLPSGKQLTSFRDTIQEIVAAETYSSLLEVRRDVLSGIRNDSKYLSGKFAKNSEIVSGPDFGDFRLSGFYRDAIDRYCGTLYSEFSLDQECIDSPTSANGKPRILILSALYGPLHPRTPIQDYNLQMSHKPAYSPWKNAFPSFLEDYVSKLNLRRLWLYVGMSTAYFRVAASAVKHLKSLQLIRKAVQFEVRNGSSRVTPQTHGELLALHLGQHGNCEVERRVQAVAL